MREGKFRLEGKFEGQGKAGWKRRADNFMGKSGLGWKIRAKAEYRVALPQLSEDEEKAVLDISALFCAQSQKTEIESGKAAAECIEKLCREYCEENSIELDAPQKKYIPKMAYLHTYANCFLDELLGDARLEEIAIFGLGKPAYVYVRGEGWKETNCSFEGAAEFCACVNKLGRNAGKRVSAQTPKINAALTDGSRMHAAIPPVCEYSLTIRKFRSEPFCAHELGKGGTASFSCLAFLWAAMQAELSIIVAGNTASGKTTTLNSLFSFVPKNERIIVAEDTAEINLPHAHVVRLLSNEESGIGMNEIIRDSLRMRPDRLVVGEMRSPKEVEAFMETVLCGQGKGSYATFHAQSANDALLRLRMLGAMTSDIPSIDLVVVQRRMESYDLKRRSSAQSRRIREVCEIREGEMPSCVPIFSLQEGELVRTKNKSFALEKISECFGCSQEELGKEMKKREKFLGEIGKKKISFLESFGKIQEFMLK